MRLWRVLIRTNNGNQFFAKVVSLSESQAVLHGEQVLPKGMVCELQVHVPPKDEWQQAGTADLKGEVAEVVFTSGGISLNFKINSLSGEARHLIDSHQGAH